MLPKVGQDRLNANYTQWLTESDLSSIAGLPPAPNHTPPTKPIITSGTNFSVDTPKIEGTTTPDALVEIYEGTKKIGD